MEEERIANKRWKKKDLQVKDGTGDKKVRNLEEDQGRDGSMEWKKFWRPMDLAHLKS